MFIGGVTLARAVKDPVLADTITDSVQTVIKKLIKWSEHLNLQRLTVTQLYHVIYVLFFLGVLWRISEKSIISSIF